MSEKSNRIVESIVNDLSDRRGLGHEWAMIDDDIKEEIKNGWSEIIDEEWSIEDES